MVELSKGWTYHGPVTNEATMSSFEKNIVRTIFKPYDMKTSFGLHTLNGFLWLKRDTFVYPSHKYPSR